MSYNAKTKYIRLPCSTLNGSSDTYECDYLMYTNNGIYPAVMGDGWYSWKPERTGAFATVLSQSKDTSMGAVLSYKKSTIPYHVSCRSDAIVNSAGIISQTNGSSRTPITKVNSGFAIGCLSTNVYTTNNWVGTILISTSRDAILLSVPDVSVPYRRPFFYQGICFWITWQSSNSANGGATEISSPIGLPITDLSLGTDPNMSYPPQENI